MKIIANTSALLIFSMYLSGCASVIYDTNQPVRISSVDKSNNAVTDVYCIMRNDNGEWNLRTDGIAYVYRSPHNLQVRCSKNGLPDGMATLISSPKIPIFEVMAVGGDLGAVIRKGNDAGFNYPDWIMVVMGDDLVYERKNQKEKQPLFGAKP